QAIRCDRRGPISADRARTRDDFLMLGALFRWEKGNAGVIQRGLLRFGDDLLGRATRDDLAIVHGGKPVEAAGLVHIGRRDEHAHGRTPRIESMSSQNCRRESGSTPVVGSSRTRRSGSCISAQHRLTFCFMPPESLPHGRLANGSRPVAGKRTSMRALRSAPPCPNKRPKKSMLSNTLSVG